MTAKEHNNTIRWFREIGLNDVNEVGGKGASLGELQAARIPIPDGFVVTTSAFRLFLQELQQQHGIVQQIEALDPEDIAAVEAETRKIRDLVMASAFPSKVAQQLQNAVNELCPAREHLAIRSSATSEDSEEASFAGLQDTYLWVQGIEAVQQHVLQCWASLYSPESVSYRLRLGLPEEQLAMGVVVQLMVNSRCSGVMFTRSPTTGDRSVVTIEGSWGLGSSIVSGEVTPDRFVVNKITREINVRNIATKAIEHIPAESGGILEREVDETRMNKSCLSDDELFALLDTARKVEAHYGKPQDIEWAIAQDSDTLMLLQSRPETVWASKDKAPVAKPAAKAFDHIFAVMGGQHKK